MYKKLARNFIYDFCLLEICSRTENRHINAPFHLITDINHFTSIAYELQRIGQKIEKKNRTFRPPINLS